MKDYSHCVKNRKNSGQMIPAFGNWDYANDLPITQYFDTARQAGLLHYTCSADCTNLYSIPPDIQKPRNTSARPRKSEGRGTGTDHARRQHKKKSSDAVMQGRKTRDPDDEICKRKVKIVNIVPKPADEDLYKIPPELLRTSKKKRMLRFFTKCLVPGCAA